MTRISRLYLIPFVLLYALLFSQLYTAVFMLAVIITWRGPIWARVER